jgi:hypothetical protein
LGVQERVAVSIKTDPGDDGMVVVCARIPVDGARIAKIIAEVRREIGAVGLGIRAPFEKYTAETSAGSIPGGSVMPFAAKALIASAPA